MNTIPDCHKSFGMMEIKVSKKTLDSFIRMLERQLDKKVRIEEEYSRGPERTYYLDHPWWDGNNCPLAWGYKEKSANRWSYRIHLRLPPIPAYWEKVPFTGATQGTEYWNNLNPFNKYLNK